MSDDLHASDVFGDDDRHRDDRQVSCQQKESQATAIVRLATEARAELWHTSAGDGYVTIRVNGHREHHQLNSRGSRDYLVRLFYLETGKAPNASALQDAINTLSGIAKFDGDEHDVHVRVAGDDHCGYLDLGDHARRAVHITSAGWAVVSDPPVRFRRLPSASCLGNTGSRDLEGRPVGGCPAFLKVAGRTSREFVCRDLTVRLGHDSTTADQALPAASSADRHRVGGHDDIHHSGPGESRLVCACRV